MTFVDRLNSLLDDPKSSPYYRKTNKESGPAGPLRIKDARDWEITWDKGRALLLQTPITKPSGKDLSDTEKKKDITWDRGGANTGTIPNDPNGPQDKLHYVNKDKNITEETLGMSYLERLAEVLALTKPSMTFKDLLKIVKSLYPDIKMQFPHPPTFIWNPKKEGKEEEEGGEDNIDESAKLEPQKIKDKLKVKLPQLKWTVRLTDGVEEAELVFDDESSALFEIGANANHLTITYTEPPKGTTIVYDDSEPEEETTPT